MDLGRFMHLADADEVADAAASGAVERLRVAIEERGRAVWVLAGGSSPMAAYRALVAEHAAALDWSQVVVLIGDERMVPFDDADSNLGAIAEVLLAHPSMTRMKVLWPNVEMEADVAARDYAHDLMGLSDAGRAPIIDLVWLGVGEDGHTLSLFPGHPESFPNEELVIPIRNSPKPPSVRITLTRAAFDRAQQVVVFATGSAKRAALDEAIQKGELPVARVARHARRVGAEVIWLFDAVMDE